jgi:hypothetical protein
MPIRVYIMFLSLILLASCTADGKDNKWINYRSSEMIHGLGWDELPANHIHRLMDNVQNNAIERLSSVPFVKLSDEELNELVFDKYKQESGHAPYLVRAVSNIKGAGGFKAYVSGNNILILHGSLSSVVSLKSNPLVVDLSFMPDNVFVEVAVSK